VANLRLWQDAVGFTQLLSQVNLRQELREHDAAIVAVCLATLRQSSEQTLSTDFADAMRPLLGLSDGLDELLRFNVRERAAYLPMLSALDAGLRQHDPSRDLSADE
jgi:hypothetical protein